MQTPDKNKSTGTTPRSVEQDKKVVSSPGKPTQPKQVQHDKKQGQ